MFFFYILGQKKEKAMKSNLNLIIWKQNICRMKEGCKDDVEIKTGFGLSSCVNPLHGLLQVHGYLNSLCLKSEAKPLIILLS